MNLEVKYEVIKNDRPWEGEEVARLISQGFEVRHATAVDRAVHYILVREVEGAEGEAE